MVDSKENYKFYLGVAGLTRSLMINFLHTFPNVMLWCKMMKMKVVNVNPGDSSDR